MIGPIIGSALAGPLGWAAETAALLLLAAMGLACYRLVRGPTLPDRVVALDLMTVLATAFAALAALASGRRSVLDVALALALVGFLSTAAFARFAERRGPPGDGEG